MAKRQSLKELQERLAQRLTAARSEGVTASWLAVEVGGQPCLLPLVQSGEIFPWTPVQTVPYTRPWYVGVANLRGGLFGVIDLASLLNAAAGSAPAVSDRVTSESRLVSLHAALGVNAVLWVARCCLVRARGRRAGPGAPVGHPCAGRRPGGCLARTGLAGARERHRFSRHRRLIGPVEALFRFCFALEGCPHGHA